MTENEMLEKVKKAIGVGGTYQDDTIQIYIDEVKDYLSCAGVDNATINSKKSLGVIARGVLDLWNYGSNGGNLSAYFLHRVSQLCLSMVESNAESDTESESIALVSADGLNIVTMDGLLFAAKEG